MKPKRRDPRKASASPKADWSELLKGATPEAVAKALLQPRKPLTPRPKRRTAVKDCM